MRGSKTPLLILLKMKIIVTKKGEAFPHNSWKEGEEVTCHENLAKMFVKNGLAELAKGEKFSNDDNTESETDGSEKSGSKKGKQ